MSKNHILYLIIGVLLYVVCITQILASQSGLRRLTIRTEDGLPIEILYPKGMQPQTRPLVLIGHGFAGSKSVLRGYAITLARAGYVTASWDYDGHGENATPLQGQSLDFNAIHTWNAVAQTGLADMMRTAILGHSMGTLTAQRIGANNPGIMATVAISPVIVDGVTPDLPKNLLLLAGQWEPEFVANAQKILELAGGPNADLSSGKGRALKVIPHVEHVSIMFSSIAEREVRQWLDIVFGPQPGYRSFVDRRMLWYGVGILGLVFLLAGIAPWILPAHLDSKNSGIALRKSLKSLAGMLFGSLMAGIIFWFIVKEWDGFLEIFGIQIGGALLCWFGIYGIVGLFFSASDLSKPSLRSIMAGLVLFVGLWLGVGLLGHYVWLNWTLVSRRLVLWPLGCLLLFPSFMVYSGMSSAPNLKEKVAGWLAQSIILVAGVIFTVQLVPDFSFVMIILPLFPVVLGVHALVASSYADRWAFALSGAGFISWLVLSVFPIILPGL